MALKPHEIRAKLANVTLDLKKGYVDPDEPKPAGWSYGDIFALMAHHAKQFHEDFHKLTGEADYHRAQSVEDFRSLLASADMHYTRLLAIAETNYQAFHRMWVEGSRLVDELEEEKLREQLAVMQEDQAQLETKINEIRERLGRVG